MTKNKIVLFVAALFICFLPGIIGSFFTAPAIDGWYSTLTKPSFNPPSWIFGPVWTALYTMMGISLYLVWTTASPKLRKQPVILFLVHLVFNGLWSIVFFAMHNPGLAFLNIIILWGMILALIIKFYPIRKSAAYLLIPYLLWVSFATVLNFSIWQLN